MEKQRKSSERKKSTSYNRVSKGASGTSTRYKNSNYRDSRYRANGRSKRQNGAKNGFKKLITLIFVVALLVLGVNFIYQKFIKVPYKYDDFIAKYSKEYKVDKELVASVIYNESRFNKDAKSNQKAYGLMQIQPETAQFVTSKLKIPYKESDLFDPEKNIRLGTYYLSYLLERFDNNLRTTIAAYNAGPTIVSKWLKDPKYSKDGQLISIPYKDTASYVDNVIRMKKEYESLIPKLGKLGN